MMQLQMQMGATQPISGVIFRDTVGETHVLHTIKGIEYQHGNV